MLSADDSNIWKALADSTRRKMLDLLRESPRTTGDLCNYFQNMTRFGVMKHLGILEKSGLIVIKRKGKYRWNYLNPVPIQTIYERWVKPYETHWAESALSLKAIVEETGGIAMSDVNAIQVALVVKINASKERVWEVIIQEIGSWWHSDFYAIPDSKILLEPHVGGRLYEKSESGAEGLWYTVTGFYPHSAIEFVGHLRPEFGGPATSLLKLALTEENGVATLQISDALFGAVDENTRKNIDSGWKTLFEEGLKRHVEGD